MKYNWTNNQFVYYEKEINRSLFILALLTLYNNILTTNKLNNVLTLSLNSNGVKKILRR